MNLKIGKIVALPLAACMAASIIACGPDTRILESANSNAAPSTVGNSSAPANTPSLEQDIAAMRNADFFFIYVFRRKDGGVLEPDDKRFMNSVIPYEINRKTISDSGKVLITGSNFRFPPEALKQMTARYDFKDLSRPESEIMNANSDNAPKP
jgi:hypothetical protein